jgi:hypothetical protein
VRCDHRAINCIAQLATLKHLDLTGGIFRYGVADLRAMPVLRHLALTVARHYPHGLEPLVGGPLKTLVVSLWLIDRSDDEDEEYEALVPSLESSLDVLRASGVDATLSVKDGYGQFW